MTGLYSHDIILDLFQRIIKQDYKNKIDTGDWGQSKEVIKVASLVRNDAKYTSCIQCPQDGENFRLYTVSQDYC